MVIKLDSEILGTKLKETPTAIIISFENRHSLAWYRDETLISNKIRLSSSPQVLQRVQNIVLHCGKRRKKRKEIRASNTRRPRVSGSFQQTMAPANTPMLLLCCYKQFFFQQSDSLEICIVEKCKIIFVFIFLSCMKENI